MSIHNLLILFVVTACFVLAQQQVIPGGEFDVDPNDPETRTILQKTIEKKNLETNEPKRLKSIIKSSKQVVSGTKHTIDFLAEGTTSNNVYQCHTVVIDAPWAVERREQDVDPTDKEAQSLLQDAIEDKNEELSEEPKTYMNIIKATKEVDDEVKYIIDFMAEGSESSSQYQCRTVIVLAAPYEVEDYSCQPIS